MSDSIYYHFKVFSTAIINMHVASTSLKYLLIDIMYGEMQHVQVLVYSKFVRCYYYFYSFLRLEDKIFTRKYLELQFWYWFFPPFSWVNEVIIVIIICAYICLQRILRCKFNENEWGGSLIEVILLFRYLILAWFFK